METEYRYLLHLMGAWIRGEAPEAALEVDWQKLLQVAQIHAVPGILGYMSMKYPICPDPEMAAQLRSLCRNTVAGFTRRGVLAEQFVAALNQAKIDHILMKGFVLRQIYPLPELRTFNDIDIVIRREDRKRCDDLMMSMGFHRHTDWEPVYSYVRGNELYELHTEIVEGKLSDRTAGSVFFETMWDHAVPAGEHSFHFTAEYHFVYLVAHAAKHVYSAGAGLRMYLDLAVFLQHHGSAMDWAWIQKQLEALQLSRFAAVMMTAAEDWFGVSCPESFEKVSRGVMDSFLMFTMEAGIFGHHNRSEAIAKLKNTDEEAPNPRLQQMLRRTFPKAATIQNRYTYLQDKPWLLPVAWVHRLVKNWEKLGRRVEQMQEILTVDEETVLQLQKMMKEIGL